MTDSPDAAGTSTPPSTPDTSARTHARAHGSAAPIPGFCHPVYHFRADPPVSDPSLCLEPVPPTAVLPEGYPPVAVPYLPTEIRWTNSSSAIPPATKLHQLYYYPPWNQLSSHHMRQIVVGSSHITGPTSQLVCAWLLNIGLVLSEEEMFYIAYGDPSDGGPLFSYDIIRVTATRMRPRLYKMGLVLASQHQHGIGLFWLADVISCRAPLRRGKYGPAHWIV